MISVPGATRGVAEAYVLLLAVDTPARMRWKSDLQ